MPTYTMPGPPRLQIPDNSPTGRRRVVIVTNPDSASLEYFWPIQVFEEANLLFDYWDLSDFGYDVEVVATRPGTVYERKGLKIEVDRPYYRVRGEVDTLMFQAVDENEMCLGDPRFLAWVKRMSGRVRRISSVCVGTYILAEAGVLHGRRATTHWAARADFERRYPEVELDSDRIYVKDGNVYTSAGSTAGLDLAATLVEEDFGADFARRVSQGLVMYLKRPGNQAQFSIHMSARFPDMDRLRDLLLYIAENPGTDLSVEALASRVCMSPRNFARVFSRQVGTTPGNYVEQSRVERARHWLEESQMRINEVARRCGYTSANGMRLAFDRHLGVTPLQYRKRFASSTDGMATR